jgi:MFS transporter, DHA1 family, multidrug resistance protein
MVLELRDTLRRLAGIPAQAWTIIVGLFVIGVGNYMVIPFFALYCTKQLGFTTVQVGLLLTMRLWTQRGCALFGGMLSDRFTARRIMVLGLLCRWAGFSGIAVCRSFYPILIFTALTGLGSALYTPAGKAALVGLGRGENKLLILSLRSTAYNVGGALGPVIGLAGTYVSYEATLLTAGVLFLVVAAAIAWLVPRSLPGQAARPLALKATAALLSDARVRTLCVAMFVFFGFYVQLELTLPLFADREFSRSAVSLLFMVNALTTIALQIPLTSWLERRSTASAVMIGFACAGVGFALIAAPLGLVSFVVGVFVFSLSEILVEPKIDSELGRIVPPALLGTGFGLASLACSIGGALGHEGGAIGLPIAQSMGRPALFFLALGGLAILCAYGISRSIRRVTSPRRTT